MTDNPSQLSDNPFATRYIIPGAVAHFFDDPSALNEIVERLKASDYGGQIVGPHGSGKTSLLRAIERALVAEQVLFHTVTLRDGQSAMPSEWKFEAKRENIRLLIIDGYEQLSRFNRWRLKRACRKAQRGLLVTAHADVGLPVIAETAPSLEIAQSIVRRLTAQNPSPVTSDDVATAYRANHGNLREMLLALYDLHERRARSPAQSS